MAGAACCGDGRGQLKPFLTGRACDLQLQEQLHALQSSTGNVEAALLAQLEDKSKALAELQGTVQGKQQELDEARASNATLTGEKACLEQVQVALKAERQGQDVSHAQMAAEMQDRSRELELVVAQLAQLRGEREALESSSKGKDGQIQELLAALDQAQAQYGLFTEESESLKAKLVAAEQGLEDERQRLGAVLL